MISQELAIFGGTPPDGAAAPPLVRGVRPRRVYVGNEFCERLLPSPGAAVRAIEGVRTSGMSATLVLPIVGPAALRRAARVLERVAEAAPGTEVVVNDWGLLRRAAREERLRPALGRCLVRTLADPRLPHHLSPSAPAPVRDALRGGPFASEPFRRLCRGYRVSRLEVDLGPLGLAPSSFSSDLPLSLWIPWGFVATGRSCPSAAVHRPPGPARFAPGPCRWECASTRVTMRAGPVEVVLRGNSVFRRHEDGADGLAREALCRMPFDRIVWQTDLPMDRCRA